MRFKSDIPQAAVLKQMLPRSSNPLFSGMYRTVAPPGAPLPYITFFGPSDGQTDITACPTPATTDERSDVQFSVFADTETEAAAILKAISRLYENWIGPMTAEDSKGEIRDTTRRGPGRLAKDPDIGYDGFVVFGFLYRLNS